MNAAQQQLAARPMARQLGRWLPLFAHTALGLLLSFGLLLAVRRLVIGQAVPVALPTTLATAVVLLLLVFAIRRAAAGQLLPWLPTAVLVTWAVACSYPGSQLVAWIIWLGAIALDMAAARRPIVRQHVRQPSADAATPGAASATATALDSDSTPPASDDQDDGDTVLQHVVRVRDAQGHEYVHATLRGEFAPGERRTTLYVGFCPPFAEVPQVEAEVIEGPAGMAKVIQALHNGAQVEVDLDEASLDDSNVTVEVAAYQVER